MNEATPFVQMIDNGDISGFLAKLDNMAASKAYLVIRDDMTNQHIRAIKESGKDNYQLFQDIKARAKQSWDYDHKMAMMMDVDRACMNVYTLLLRIFKAHNDSYAEELNQIRTAINRIEEKVGLEPTSWEEPKSDNSTDGGNNDAGDVQGVQENI
jgi:Mg2+ and Co2+ transporter CorA